GECGPEFSILHAKPDHQSFIIIDQFFASAPYVMSSPAACSIRRVDAHAVQVSFYPFISPLASSIMATGLPEVASRFHITGETIIALTLSIFLISFGIAPLFLAPLSEMYGRCGLLPHQVLNICFITIKFGVCDFFGLAGVSGSAPIACGGVVGDLFPERDRAAAMAIYSLGPLIHPGVGPIMGGFVTETIGIKYVFIVVAGLGGIASALGIPFLKETYAPLLRLRLTKKAADPEKAMLQHAVLVAQHSSKLYYLRINLSRPAILLFGSPVCFMLIQSIFLLCPLFSTTYGFNLAKKHGGKGEPEMRIPALIFGSLFVPVGLFWYGWSAQVKIHWIMPIIRSGMMCTFLPIQLYLVDTFTYAASALSTAFVFRSLLGFAFPLFGQLGDGNSLLGGLCDLPPFLKCAVCHAFNYRTRHRKHLFPICILGGPDPFVCSPINLHFHGAAIREKSKLSR
ncbi:major facilitator superfamily domain-containing protein, partial [Mycena galopus ATCC 62051]